MARVIKGFKVALEKLYRISCHLEINLLRFEQLGIVLGNSIQRT